MLPGAVKYGGLGAFLALCAPGEAVVHNHQGSGIGKLAEAAYDAAGTLQYTRRIAGEYEVYLYSLNATLFLAGFISNVSDNLRLDSLSCQAKLVEC